MCGINGIINWEGITPEDDDKVAISLSAMVYRGPDHSDIFKSKFAILGHNRLAILDLNKRSNQPMSSSDKRFKIVFNGEIYNHNDIRKELIAHGVQFTTTSDTEVLLIGYMIFGNTILKKIRGMFAFVIWDSLEKRCFAARDRFGEKPFYYTLDNHNNFSFASNLQGIVKLQNHRMEINKQAVFELLSKQFLSEAVIYKGLRKLKPGYFIELNKDGFEEKKYWDLNYNQKSETSFAEAKSRVESLLFESVSEQLEADVPVGVYLSGGTDSSIITAMASRKKKDVTALTMSTPNSSTDEAETASYVAKLLGVQHKIIPLDISSIKYLTRILRTMEPLADVSLIPSMAIANEASKEFKVMLSGDGADELFGGYRVPVKYGQNPFKGNVISKKLIGESLKGNGSISRYLNDKLTMSRLFKWGGSELFYTSIKSPTQEVLNLLNFDNAIIDENTSYKEIRSKVSSGSEVFMYLGIKDKLVNDFLFKMDSSSMFFSVETRAPYLDHRLIDFTSSLSLSTLMPTGSDKELLKSIGAKYIPKEFFNLPKKGFSIPYYDYLKNDWGNLLMKLTNENISADMGIINPLNVVKLVKNYRKKPSYRIGRLLYSILVFEIWLRVFHLNIDVSNTILND